MSTANPALEATTLELLAPHAHDERVTLMNTVHKSGLLLIILMAVAFKLVLDFDYIAQRSELGRLRYMEWYAAFGLLVTLVWLYIEILHLLMKLQSRD
jgi:uncharacterized YccA/Bax inhibitor family protein